MIHACHLVLLEQRNTEDYNWSYSYNRRRKGYIQKIGGEGALKTAIWKTREEIEGQYLNGS
jgi:hypothetical protein